MSALLNIEVANTSSQVVASGGFCNLGLVLRKYCKSTCCTSTFSYTPSSTELTLNQTGYYKVDVVMSVSSSSTGDAEVSLFANGLELPQTNMVESIATASTEFRTLSFTTTIRVFNNSPITLKIANVGTIPLTIEPLDMDIVKIC